MNRAVLVTGGTGDLGWAIVEKLAKSGWRVAFTYRRDEKAATELAEATGAFPFQVDLTRPEAVSAMAAAVEERLGELYGLVNNAGQTQVMPFALLTPEDWDEIISGNLKTMFLTTHAVVRGMIRQKRGVIVNMGSIAGHRVLEVPIHYATSKAGVSGFTTGLARELARYHIRVNEVVPGMLSGGVSRLVPEPEMKEYLRYCLAGRPGECAEVAEVVEFLLSDRASYINAQSLHVNGGI